MAKKPKVAGRALALLLAAIMTMGSFQTTTYAAGYGGIGSLTSASAVIDDPVSGVTGSGWDNIGIGGSDTPSETPSEDEDPETPPEDGEPGDSEQPGDGDPVPPPEGGEPGDGERPEDGGDGDEIEDDPSSPTEGEGENPGGENPPANGAIDAGDLNGVDDSNVPTGGTELPWVTNLRAIYEAEHASIMPFAAGDAGGGTVTSEIYSWGVSGGDGSNSIWMGSEPGGNGYYFAEMYPVTYDGSTAFCGEFNGRRPGGNYVNSGEGNNEKIKQIIASYEASGKGRADYIAAQTLIWAELLGTTVTSWGASGANTDLLVPGIDTSGIRYWTYSNTDAVHTQNIFVYTTDETIHEYALKIIKTSEDGDSLEGATFTVTGPNNFELTGVKTNSQGEILVGVDAPGDYTVTETSPPEGYQLADPNSQVVTVTEENKQQNPAEVEFVNAVDPDSPPTPPDEDKKTYARGQITIRKEDQDGNSLDGAKFDVKLEFSNGTVYDPYVQNWEVDNGARLLTWTHPEGDYGPVKVTVTEVEAPEHYDLDPTPHSATVNPSYLVTVDVDTGEETVTEIEDSGVGDLDVTITITNTRKTGDIIVIKRDANTGAALAGASIHLWSTDLGGVDEGATDVDLVKVTDENGEARFENLPAGSYAVQETRAPAGYNLNDEVKPVTLQSSEVVTIEVNDYKKDGLFIKKVDENGQPLAGAVFELRRGSGEVLLSDVTDENGLIYRGNLTDDTYIIEEIQAPEGYLLDENPIKQIRIYATDDNKEYTVTFVNKKKPAIEVIKVDGLDPTIKLEGASFRITNSRTGQYWDITTGEDGTALLENLEIDTTYIVEETDAPEGYINSGYRQEIVLKECRTHTITVENFEHPGIQIVKKDKQTGEPLAGATFRISWEDGQQYRDVTTGEDGTALVTGLNAGWYTIVETKAPEGYLLDTTPHNVMLEEGKTAVVEIFDEAKPSLTIYKLDSVTQTPLANATFRIEKKTDNGTELIGEYTSDADGIVRLEQIDPGRYLITEIKAPDGYNIDAPTQEVTIEYGVAYEVTFTDTPKSPIYIAKVDQDGNPLAGAKFKVTTMNGAMVGEVETGRTGYAIIPYAEPGWYVVEEIQAPDGYILSETPVNIEVKSGKPATVEFVNYARPGLQILKLDADTREPLVGARFKIAYANGVFIGEYTTNVNGLITLDSDDGLTEGAVVVTEIQAPDGYVLDVTPHNVTLKPGELTQIELFNTSKPGLQLIKKDEITGLPVGGARFNVTLLENGGKKDLGTYTTSENGTFFIADLTPGHYVITETKAADGYILDSTPRYIEVEGGKLNTLEVFNTPYSDLRLLKIDSETRDPLEGAVFKLYDHDRLEIGTYTTNNLGEIFVQSLPSGTYYLQEQKAPAGYVLDNTVREIELVGGKTTTVEWKNTALGTLRIIKVDADTGKPLYGATFLLYDNRNNLLGEYTTDQNGLIVFGTSLQAGKYKLKEIKAPDGYVLDETIRTITVQSGTTTEIEIENELQVGNIQIVKVSNGKNEVTGDKKGDGLSGAVFEIYDEDLNLVDKIETDGRGIATSDDLPLGKYIIKEVEAPRYYFTDGKPFYAEIKTHGDLVRFRVENTPIDIEVSVEKRGVAETMSNEVIRYTFSDIANKSNCSLDDFYWRDNLPEEVRIQSLNTGTWNQRGTYDVYIKTNKKSGWRRIERGLHTNVEYTIDLTGDALGLASNEYVTDFKLEFGTVDAGFAADTDPYIKVKVNDDLDAGTQIVNTTDVGGRKGHEWTYDRDSWITVVYKGSGSSDGGHGGKKLPQTGGPNFFEQYPEYLKYLED